MRGLYEEVLNLIYSNCAMADAKSGHEGADGDSGDVVHDVSEAILLQEGRACLL
jgi:hypothetical protein